MSNIYGYARVSTKTQNLERQITEIEKEQARLYPQGTITKIYKDKFRGTTLNRDEWQKLYNRVKENDTIIFESVDRLSRNAKEGVEVYQELYTRGVNLIFINDPLINTDNYKKSMSEKLSLTGITEADFYIEATNKLLLHLAKKQVKIAFEQAQKDNETRSRRVKEGQAKTNKKIGIEKGRKLTTQKSKQFKPIILESSKDFNGSMTDKKLMEHLGLSRNTFYKYKRELKQEQE